MRFNSSEALKLAEQADSAPPLRSSDGDMGLVAHALTFLTRAGGGEVCRNFEDSHPSAKIGTLPFFLTRGAPAVALDPQNTEHPLKRFLGSARKPAEPPSHPFRSSIDGRSFHCLTDCDGQAHTLVFKGDLSFASASQNADKIEQGQIPAGLDLDVALREYDAAVLLQELAARHGMSWLPLPTPVRVVRIDSVVSNDGVPLTIKDFLNSEMYGTNARPLAQNARTGDLLIDKLELRPAQYLYDVPGSNQRVSELAELLIFDQSPWDLGYLVADPRGYLLKSQGYTCAEVVAGAQAMLGEEYGHSLPRAELEVLSDPFLGSSVTVRKMQQTFASVLDSQGKPVIDDIFAKFVTRLTATAALAHANQVTFTNQDMRSQGSLTARNVTIGGAVLDHATVRQQNDWIERVITADFIDALVSIGFMRRLLSPDAPRGIFAGARASYLHFASRVNPDSVAPLRAATAKSRIPWEILQSL